MSKKSVSDTWLKYEKFSTKPRGGGGAYLFQACLKGGGVIERGDLFSLADSDF